MDLFRIRDRVRDIAVTTQFSSSRSRTAHVVLHGASIQASQLEHLLFSFLFSMYPSPSHPSNLIVAEVAGRSQLSFVSNFFFSRNPVPAYDR